MGVNRAWGRAWISGPGSLLRAKERGVAEDKEAIASSVRDAWDEGG